MSPTSAGDVEALISRGEALLEHANTALDLLTALAMPQAKHAADLIAQIDHNRYLR